MSIIPSPTPKISPNVGYWQDCNTIVYTMNSLRAFIHFYYQDRTPYILNSDNHIPKMFTHNLLNCPILIIKSNVSPEMTKQSVQFMWTWFFSELKKRTAPVFFDFTETHPTIITKLCSALQCVVSFKMRGYSASLDKLFILKTLREAFIIGTPQCSHLPPATILSLDCLAMQEHIDWRPLHRENVRSNSTGNPFAYDLHVPVAPCWDGISLFLFNRAFFPLHGTVFPSIATGFLEDCPVHERTRRIGQAHRSAIRWDKPKGKGFRATVSKTTGHFLCVLRPETKELTYFAAQAEMMYEHFANLFQPNLDKSDMLFLSLNAVRGAILQNPSIQRTLVALHCCTWNPITFKITFGDRVTMETLIDDTPGSDEIYHLETIVKKSLAQRVYCCNLR